MAARNDPPADPAPLEQLLLARRATGFFAHELHGLSDAELDGGSLLPGWTRRHVVAHVASNARAIARLVAWARTGVETPMYDSLAARDAEIEAGAALGLDTLRSQFDVGTIQLDAAWRGLTPEAWGRAVRTVRGRDVPVSETVWMRNQELWVHTVDLATGAGFGDIPEPVLERLLAEITAAWAARGDGADLVLSIEGPGRLPAATALDSAALDSTALDSAAPVVVTGTLAGLAEWATGRGTSGVTSTTSVVPLAPRWL